MINKYISTTIGTQVIFDDDIIFDEEKDGNGVITKKGIPKVQFKQILGIGMSYDF